MASRWVKASGVLNLFCYPHQASMSPELNAFLMFLGNLAQDVQPHLGQGYGQTKQVNIDRLVGQIRADLEHEQRSCTG